MGVSHVWGYFVFKSGISPRVPALPEWFGKKFRLPSKKWIGLTYIVFSGVLGLGAFKWTQEEVLTRWRRQHFPSWRVLNSSFNALGLREVSQPDQQQRILRSLPVSTDDSGRLWFTDDLAWVALFLEGESGSELKVFCHSCQDQARNWMPARLGWEGFEQILETLEKRIEREKSALRLATHKRVDVRDAREIIY